MNGSGRIFATSETVCDKYYMRKGTRVCITIFRQKFTMDAHAIFIDLKFFFHF